ncbi:MAG: TonB-dependent receptor, partial [Bacteroidia bacterium]|nr:TonB-dependent receptor [Bacteroidia bacterium]
IQKSQQGGGSPMIRGFATNRILLVIDDVRMNTAIFRSGNVQNVISIDPFIIEQADVIFGPASQFYGSDALGGVLSFKTKNPEHSKSDTTLYAGNIGIRLGTSSKEKTWHAHFNVGTKNFASLSSISFNNFGNLQMGNNGPDEYARKNYVAVFNGFDSIVSNPNQNEQVLSGYNQINLLQKFSFKLNKNSQLIYNFQYANTSNIPRYDRLILENDSGVLTNGDWYYGPQVWMLNQLAFDNDKAYILSDYIKINIAHQKFTESRNDRKYKSSLLRERTEIVNALSANADFEKRISKRLKLNYGGEYIYNLVNSTGQILNIIDGRTSATSSRYPDGSTWRSYGIYINALRKWNSWFKTEAGIRYSSNQTSGTFDTTYYPFPESTFSNNNQAVTGSFSQLFKLKKGTIGVIASSGFRSPNIDDISKVFDSNPGLVVLPNPNLKSEIAYNGEINFNYAFNKKLKTSISIFYTYLDNAIGKELSTFNGMDSIFYDGVKSQVEQLVNQDFATIMGSQISLSYLINEHWNLETSYTFLESSSSNNEPIRHITPNFGGTSINYKRKTLSLSLYAQYNQEFKSNQFTLNELNAAYLYAKDENGLPYSPAWATFNIKGSYQLNESVQINAGVENILNKRYRPYSSGISASGVNFLAALNVNF